MKTLSFEAVVIGSGCAGYNCADRLWELGIRNIAVITEGRLCGTSRNTGSDKQTYYKLSLAGDTPDSVREMAQTLFDGGAMDGDIALAEAANSARCFLKLVGLGVPFPTNEVGEFVGYKTDHDPACRATSIGPYTSKKMTEVLENAVLAKGIPILDGLQVVKILTDERKTVGLLAISLSDPSETVAVRTSCVVLATGGPAALYRDSVYPESQTGSSALALNAGATFQNLSEWQYGLASVDFRWNVSGTYQQVLPRYVSIDENGTEREFLLPFFENPAKMLENCFLKGYEWPFDVRKLHGSSRIDLLVYRESVVLGRKVYLDFTKDPTGLENGFDGLDPVCHSYLKKSDALCALPIERLARMNPGAISLYAEHGIDLWKEPLRIAVCAQHHNGGVGVDARWQTDVAGLYTAGEAAGTFGVFRPGGSALNSTQVGSLRAAEHIARHADRSPSPRFEEISEREAEKIREWIRAARGEISTIAAMRETYGKLMSRSFAFLRDPDDMKRAKRQLEQWKTDFLKDNRWANVRDLPHWFKNREILDLAIAVADAMIFAAERYGSRGSALVGTSSDPLSVTPVAEWEAGRKEVLLTRLDRAGAPVSSVRPVRPIPDRELWFETVWKSYREETGEQA